MQGPGYNERTRTGIDGIHRTHPGNERPFMTQLDEFRSTTGMMTWNPDKPQMRAPGHGPSNRVRNFADEGVRAQQALRTTSHHALNFLGQFPGVTPSNPMAVRGGRVLSSKFIPLEMKGDGLLYVHPSQRELLQWTQEQLRHDAKENGRDLAAEMDEKIEEVLQHDPIQPYTELAANRRIVSELAREEIINQESRLHKRRQEKGLPIPPIMMPQYDTEYPDSPGGAAKTVRYYEHYHAFRGWRTRAQLAGVKFGTTAPMMKRIKRRQEHYTQELRDQGIDVPKFTQTFDDSFSVLERPDQYAIAEQRAMRRFGHSAHDPDVIDSNPDTVLSED
eukprot:TRINITY_DN50369_c0_g1_i1.p1 TRINITY_DN50369_c0_g1~~TRINITY_DN50369_c0_g1_i1.p1  ORF type:complete len:387 (+),score=75.77 TRINITY_DN50369_c0_g1_i1:164-1162(+)